MSVAWSGNAPPRGLTASLLDPLRRVGFWRFFAVCMGALLFIPIAVTLASWFNPDMEVWRHVQETLLAEILTNTLLLVFGVGSGVLFIGVGLAWLTARCDFPGRNIFDWALILPLAVPTYVLAFVFVGLFEYAGPVQGFLRETISSDLRLPSIRSTPGLILVMSLVLYPYVYMLSRAAFLSQGTAPIEAARVQGLGAWGSFFRVALPMARPAIAAGTALALMETLADFGAVSVFNFETFTTAIYRAWFGYYSLAAAGQLAALLLLFILLGLTAEKMARGRARFDQRQGGEITRIQLHGWRAWAATGFAFTVLFLGFLLPVLQLMIWGWGYLADFNERYLELVVNTLTLGAVSAVVTVSIALMLAYARRAQPDFITRRAVGASTLGYALPGSVLAVGIMIVFTWLDHRVADLLEPLVGDLGGQLLTGSVFALVLAYVMRFMAVAFGAVDSALEQIRPSLREAARSLGARDSEIIRRIYIPVLRPGLITAALLVGVDVMKEMPATLLLRPFGWDTLAVRIFEFTVEGQWERAALPAVTLVAVGLIPVIFLVNRTVRKHPRNQKPAAAEALQN
ncbi:iron(III) transport system permease protein [Alkalispirillum mobile]|uniref:Iron(III) transport system permease protein n=1 Tax=Alkalispirillum mobile TaxID=85925 RepID=A0A498BY20_9GAMM|nr:iron ABC transporter permease [Alkalispirillum mobile]RLK48172.1 iron(III) transport system permease protein [Alkalispirillum mobile]